MTYNE
jgi:hypothetical protein